MNRLSLGDNVLVRTTQVVPKTIRATVVGFIVKFDQPLITDHGSYGSTVSLYGQTIIQNIPKEKYDIEIVIK